jgi:hypothetical protein
MTLRSRRRGIVGSTVTDELNMAFMQTPVKRLGRRRRPPA